MSISTHIDKANAGDPVTIAWLDWTHQMQQQCASRYPYPASTIIATEQVFMRSAKGFCYLCGHPTKHRQTTGISFPPVARNAYICAECDE